MIKIGQQFAQVRQEKGLTLTQVSHATKIREDFLRAIEHGDYKVLPGSSYAYGFVRNYAKFLGLPVEKSLALFRREFDETKNVEILPRGFTNPKEYSVSRFKIGRTAIAVFLVCLVVVAFIIFQYRAALFNPSLKVDSPKANSTLNSLNIEVTGRTDPEAILTIDGSQVSVDENGKFTKQITVFPGDVIIEIKAENKFGKVSEIKRPVKVKP
jgi:cytoskeletal protein RodZ